MLDNLSSQGVKATFCLVGSRARSYPDLVRRIVAEGHTLCNHSWQHRLDLATRDPNAIRQDLEMTNDAIHRAVPNVPIKYFRAPGGNFTNQLVRIAQEEGMTSLFWSVDPRDWDNSTYGTGQRMVDHVTSAVNRGVQLGSIVLSHDSGHPETIEAYRRLIPELKARFTLIALP
jgi:peptidoglycan/xylan/chitin deacetylase (PgdA/CDA1 family)